MGLNQGLDMGTNPIHTTMGSGLVMQSFPSLLGWVVNGITQFTGLVMVREVMSTHIRLMLLSARTDHITQGYVGYLTGSELT